MKIKNLNIHNSNVVFAEKIHNLSYSNSFQISQEEFTSLKTGVSKIDPQSIEEIGNQIKSISNESHPEQKSTKLSKLRQSIINHGVAIAQNLSASVIYDVLKSLF